jgi:hypothetical protein
MSALSRTDLTQQYDPPPADRAKQQYVRKLMAENAALKAQQGSDSMLYEAVKDAIVGMEPPKPISYAKPKLHHDPLHAVLVTTDQHAEEFVGLEEMEGLAQYNWDIFERRMGQTTKKTIELTNIMRQASAVPVLDIWSLGDWFCGAIHPEEGAYGVSMPMPMAVPKVGMRFAQMIHGLAAHFEKINVWGMCGNHGREGKKPVTKMTADRNWDMSVYLIAQGYTEKLDNVEWHIPHSIMSVTDVEGWNCLLTHSGEVNMNNRTPYYPIESTFDMEHKSRTGTDKDFTYAFTGHWHHHAVLDSKIIMCPSMIGNNQYSRFRLHRSSSPEQLLCFFTHKHGLINQWPIKLGDVK